MCKCYKYIQIYVALKQNCVYCEEYNKSIEKQIHKENKTQNSHAQNCFCLWQKTQFTVTLSVFKSNVL